MGYYNLATRTVQTTRSNQTGNTATYVGLYNDVRAAGTLGTASQLSVVPEPTSLALAGVAVAAGMLNVVRRRR